MKTFGERVLFPQTVINKKRLNKIIFGKTIVITGASYGIGEELSLLFSDYNTHLVLIARTECKLQSIVNIIAGKGSRCTIIVANLYHEEDVDRVITELEKIPEGIDIFISNAGKSIMRPLSRSLDRYHDFTRTNSVNYLAPVKMLLAATSVLSKRKGQIINVSAINTLLLPSPGWAAYQASKTAFDQWFRANTAEWALMGIKARTIYLPLVKTRMIAPNKHYENYPAMEPGQAAIRIARLICSSNSYSKPWWLIFIQTGSFFGRRIWESISSHILKIPDNDV